uniref:Uncharacterized protein n=1 Tax=Knipowitschia caucasica TaxID=637954 RepID=A0AAV2JG15_KNICA
MSCLTLDRVEASAEEYCPDSELVFVVKQRRSVLQTQMRIQTDVDLSDAAVSEQLLKLVRPCLMFSLYNLTHSDSFSNSSKKDSRRKALGLTSNCDGARPQKSKTLHKFMKRPTF